VLGAAGGGSQQIGLSEEAERALQNLYLFECAQGYLVRPEEGFGPAEEKLACLEKVEQDDLDLAAVRTLSSTGSGYSLTEAEMEAMVRDGPAYLEDYVRKLLQDDGGDARVADLE
jgi:hypothetical protein